MWKILENLVPPIHHGEYGGTKLHAGNAGIPYEPRVTGYTQNCCSISNSLIDLVPKRDENTTKEIGCVQQLIGAPHLKHSKKKKKEPTLPFIANPYITLSMFQLKE